MMLKGNPFIDECYYLSYDPDSKNDSGYVLFLKHYFGFCAIISHSINFCICFYRAVKCK